MKLIVNCDRSAFPEKFTTSMTRYVFVYESVRFRNVLYSSMSKDGQLWVAILVEWIAITTGSEIESNEFITWDVCAFWNIIYVHTHQ